MLVSQIKGLSSRLADIYLENLIQGEQTPQYLSFVDADDNAIDLTSVNITVRYRKASAKIESKGSVPVISKIVWSTAAGDSGTFPVVKTSTTGLWYFLVPKDFNTADLQWDQNQSVACALVEVEYQYRFAGVQKNQKHRFWLAFYPSLEYS